MTKRIAIIGAGHNGLVAAGYLARAGHQVTVLEGSDTVGGLCQTDEVLPGFRGNLASNTPHNFDPTIIDDLELESYGLEWITIDGPSAMVLLPDGQRIISHRERTLRWNELAAFGTAEAQAHEATLDELTQLGRRLNVSFYGPPPTFAELASRVSPGREDALFSRVMFGSATEVVSERIKSPGLRASLAMLAVTGNFQGPSVQGSAYQLMQRPLYRGSDEARSKRKVQMLAEFASRTPRGGMGALTASLARSAQAYGAKMILSSPIAVIDVVDGRVRAVVDATGAEYPADIVVSAASPVATMVDLLPDHAVDPSLKSSLRSLPMDGAMGKVYLGLNGVPQFAAARSSAENAMMLRCGFRIGPNVEEMDRSYHLARLGSFEGAPIIYGLTQSIFDPTLNPEGRHLMSLSVSYAPRHLASGTWAEHKSAWIQHVITHLTEHIPNLQSILDSAGASTPEDLENRFSLRGGNALHGDVTADRMFGWRPWSGLSDYTTPVRGLYLCSVGTWPGNYVSGLGGRNASLRVLADVAGDIEAGVAREESVGIN